MRNNERITTVMEGKIEGGPRTPFMKRIVEDTGRTTHKGLKVAVTG